MFHGGGWWVIFPIIGVIFMLVMMMGMFGMSRRGTGHGAGMGPMGMGGHGAQNGGRRESALDVLQRRYAAGELSDEQFDSMSRKLEGHSP